MKTKQKKKSQMTGMRFFKLTIGCLVAWGIGYAVAVGNGCSLSREKWQNISFGRKSDAIASGIKTGYGDYLAGFIAQQNQDYDKTTRYFERALKKDPDNETLKVSVYLLKAIQGRFDEETPKLTEIAELKRPELLADYALIAQALRQTPNPDYQAALAILESKPAYGPDAVIKPALKAWLLAGLGREKEAKKALDEMMKNPEAHQSYLYYKGLLAVFLNQPKQADEAFLEMIRGKSYPSLSAPILMRAFYQSQNRWHVGETAYDFFYDKIETIAAVRDVVHGISSVPSLTPLVGIAVVFYDMSVSLGSVKMTEAGLIFDELAIYLIPQATVPKVWGAELLESVRAYSAAMRMYDRIRNPSDIILFKKAITLMSDERYAEALPVLQNVGKRNRSNALVQKMLAEAYAQTGQPKEAVSVYLLVADLLRSSGKTEDLGKVLLGLGAAYDETGEKDKAEHVLAEALAVAPNDPFVLNYLGYLWLEQNKNTDEAFALVKKAHDLKPEDPYIMDSLALGYYALKEYQKALALAEASVDLVPYSAVAYDHLGDIYMALNRPQEALYQYQKALKMTADMTPELQKRLLKKEKALSENFEGAALKTNRAEESLN